MTEQALSNHGDRIDMTRGQVMFANDEQGRAYFTDDGTARASVTTHLGKLSNGEKKSRLNNWMERNSHLVQATWIDHTDDDVTTASFTDVLAPTNPEPVLVPAAREEDEEVVLELREPEAVLTPTTVDTVFHEDDTKPRHTAAVDESIVRAAGRYAILHDRADAVWIDGELHTTKYNQWKDYAAARGTLGHYLLLNPYANDEIWGVEERASVETLLDMIEITFPNDYSIRLGGDAMFDDPPTTAEEIADELKGASIKEIHEAAERIQNNVSSQSQSIVLDEIYWIADNARDELDDLDEVISSEKYLTHAEHDYAGQVDLIYRNKDADLVFADLKTGLSLYKQYRMQLVAYATAAPRDYLREEYDCDGDLVLKNLRANPERDEVELQEDTDWRYGFEKMHEWFVDLVNQNNEEFFPVQDAVETSRTSTEHADAVNAD